MRHAVALIALALAACGPSSADLPQADQWRVIRLSATPITFPNERIDRLRFRGGLEFSAPEGMFGGLSGLEVLDDGRIIAVSDNADWFEARLVLDESETLIGLANARMAYMRDERAAPFRRKVDGDAEALAQLPDGRFAVAFEQTQSIRIYDLNRDGPFGAARAGPRLAETRRLRANAGLEAMAAREDGSLLVGAEGGRGATTLWLADVQASTPAEPYARYDLRDGFSLTSMDRLPGGGGYVALERFFAPVVGARARITQFADASLEQGALIEPVRLAEIAAPMPGDNFEGIAAVRLPSGALRLYILSDNNFSARQRTLLLAFDVEQAAF